MLLGGGALGGGLGDFSKSLYEVIVLSFGEQFPDTTSDVANQVCGSRGIN